MKKSIALFALMMSFIFMLTACGTAETQDEEDGKALVAYFSYTGTTKAVAEQISDLTGGDLAEIRRTEEYEDLEEEAEQEILNGVHPEITVSVDNIEDYDTIFVGYPIWLAYLKLIQCTQA